MAATERRRVAITRCAIAVLLTIAPLPADQAADIRSQISYIANALTSANPADAMVPFDKSFADYEKLSNYFQGLTAFELQNELSFVDEQDTDNESKVTVDWALTVTDQASDATERREGEINVRLARKGGKWKITGFSPISLFNPQKALPKR